MAIAITKMLFMGRPLVERENNTSITSSTVKMRFGLYSRLFLPLALFLGLTVGITVWASQSAARNAEARIDAQLDAIANTICQPPSFPLSNRVLNQMKGLSGAEFVWVDKTGASTATQLGTQPDTTNLVVFWNGKEYRKRSVPLTLPPNDGGTLHIFYPEELRQVAVSEAVRPILWLGAVSCIVGLILAMLFSYWLLSRLSLLRGQTQRIGLGDFSATPLPSTQDELTDLSRAMNQMAGKLEQSEKELKQSERMAVLGQFAGGLAHQIRNAAAGAKLALELQKDTPDAEANEVARLQLERIERTVKQFLDLGKPIAKPLKPSDLQSAVKEAVRLHIPKAQHLGIAIKHEELSGPALANVEVQEIVHALCNVITNALDAAGPGGEVFIEGFTKLENYWRCQISDTGPGPLQGLELFKPFASAKPGGIGLGLVVVKEIIQAYGGTVTLIRNGDQTIFTIQIPQP